MNRACALKCLGLTDNYSEDEMKREYRKRLLQYHPDKNKSPCASDKFIEVQEAYEFLNNCKHCNDSYCDILKSFLSSIFREDGASLKITILSKIVELICSVVEDRIIEYLRTINRDTLKTIYSILSKHRNVFPAELFERMDEIILDDECIILNPELDDLLSDENVYILRRDTGVYLVPLWHHDMVFDVSGANLVVKNYPILPDNMELDECNVLTVNLRYNLSELWNREVDVDVGGKMFRLSGESLKLTGDPQRVEYFDCGVPFNNPDNVMDVSKRQSIVLMVTLICHF